MLNLKKFLLPIFFSFFLMASLFLSAKNLLGIPHKNNDKSINDANSTHLVLHGNNSFGQLGEASYILGTTFNDLYLPQKITNIAVGRNYTLALTNSGKVMAWGGNEWGQLGHKTEGTYYSEEPKEINGIENAIKIASSNNHSMILLTDGKVMTFGSNFSGQLGTGDNVDNELPQIVQNIEDVKDIAAGYKFSVALKSDGSVWGWGASCAEKTKREAIEWWDIAISNINSIDGGYYDPTSDALAQFDKSEYCINEEIVGILSKTPVKIQNLESISSLSAGYGHVLALDDKGRVWSFGCNTYKQLGRKIASRAENPIPNLVNGLTNVKQVAAGFRHSMALKDDGTLWGWGLNNHGQLGAKSSEEIQPEPIQIPINDVSYVIAAYDYTIALKDDGTLWGWGMDRQNLFTESEEDEYVAEPVKINGFEKIDKVSASGANVVAIKIN